MPQTRYTHVSQDVVQKVVTEGYVERVTNSMLGVPGGFVLCGVGVAFLWWGEHYHVDAAGALKSLAAKVVSITGRSGAMTGQVVHTSGAVSGEAVADSRFGVGEVGEVEAVADTVPTAVDVPFAAAEDAVPTARAVGVAARKLLFLRRKCEMYQWIQEESHESREKIGGGSETVVTYKYKKKWKARWQDASEFEKQRGHENPEPEACDAEFRPSWTKIGPFAVDASAVVSVLQLSARRLHPNMAPQDKQGRDWRARMEPQGDWWYLGGYERLPSVGKSRVQWEAAAQHPDLEASVIGVLTDDGSIAAGRGDDGEEIPLLVELGRVSPEGMVASAEVTGRILRYASRTLGVVATYVGARAILEPGVRTSALIPLLSTLVGSGAAVVAAEVSLVLSASTIAFAWLHARVATLRLVRDTPILKTPLRVLFKATCAGVIIAAGYRVFRLNRAVAVKLAAAAAGAVDSVALG